MNLDEVRVKINDINDQMLELFKERMELSKDVAAAKKEMNKAIYDAKRERDILDKVTRDAGPVSYTHLLHIDLMFLKALQGSHSVLPLLALNYFELNEALNR